MLDTLPAPAVSQSTDLELLQGTWTSVAGRRSAQLFIRGNRFTFVMQEDKIYMGTFFLDDEQVPKQMDMLIEEGPARDRGLISLCIYQVEGDVLRWCPTQAGTDRRLRGFPSVEDEKHLSMIFKHVRHKRA